MTIPFRATPTSVTVVIKGVTHTLTEGGHPNYTKVREALKNKEWDTIEALIDIPTAIKEWGHGKVEIINGQVVYAGNAVHGTIARRMLEQMAEGFDITPMALFLENLMQNPSFRAVEETYDFLEACNLPITDDGHLIAYKRIKNDWKDIYTGKIDNSVGAVVTMPRNMVDEDKARTCSAGLHFCSQSYLPHYSHSPDDRIVAVKINPRDIVAIPADYNNAKGRTCRYEVTEELDKSKLDFGTSVYVTDDGSDDHDYFDDGESDSDEFYEFDTQQGPYIVYVDGLNGLQEKGEYVTSSEAIDHAEELMENYPHVHVFIEDADGAVIWDGTEDWTGEAKPSDAGFVPQTTLNTNNPWPFPTSKVDVEPPVQAPAPAPAPMPAPPAMQTVLFTKEQAAAVLGCSLDHLETMLNAGTAVEAVGDKVRFRY